LDGPKPLGSEIVPNQSAQVAERCFGVPENGRPQVRGAYLVEFLSGHVKLVMKERKCELLPVARRGQLLKLCEPFSEGRRGQRRFVEDKFADPPGKEDGRRKTALSTVRVAKEKNGLFHRLNYRRNIARLILETVPFGGVRFSSTSSCDRIDSESIFK
jgi:hypothetical protein